MVSWFSPLTMIALALAALGVFIVAGDLGIAAWQFGPDYVQRLVLWRRPDPSDRQRFPIRSIAASAHPIKFARDPLGEAAVRAAFTQIRGETWSGASLEQKLAAAGTSSFLVLQRGKLIYAAYMNGNEPHTPQNSFSMAKSVVGLLVGAAIADGRLPPAEQPVELLLPAVVGLRGSGITLRHLLDMTSGFALDLRRPLGPFSQPWSAAARMHFSPDLRAIAAAVQPEVPPGTRFLYDDRNAMLLGMVLEQATGTTVSHFLEQRLWQPMGSACAADWILDSETHGFEKMESGIGACAEDFLRIGALVLRGGLAEDGTRVLPANLIAELGGAGEPAAGFTPRFGADAAETKEGYGQFWWRVANPAGPADIYAYGMLGQVLYVSRAQETVVLRTGDREGDIVWPVLLHDLILAISDISRGGKAKP